MRWRVKRAVSAPAFKKVLQFLKKYLLFGRRYGNIIKPISAKTEYGRLAQLVEHLLDVQEVTGSSPVPSTTKILRHSSGDFFVCGGRYRTRTAAEATAACGGNREPRLGPRSDFSKPCQGAAEKSANATRTGASRQIPSRFPTRRNVYQERCRQTIRSGDFFRGGRYRTQIGTNKGGVSP